MRVGVEDRDRVVGRVAAQVLQDARATCGSWTTTTSTLDSTVVEPAPELLDRRVGQPDPVLVLVVLAGAAQERVGEARHPQPADLDDHRPVRAVGAAAGRTGSGRSRRRRPSPSTTCRSRGCRRRRPSASPSSRRARSATTPAACPCRSGRRRRSAAARASRAAAPGARARCCGGRSPGRTAGARSARGCSPGETTSRARPTSWPLMSWSSAVCERFSDCSASSARGRSGPCA